MMSLTAWVAAALAAALALNTAVYLIGSRREAKTTKSYRVQAHWDFGGQTFYYEGIFDGFDKDDAAATLVAIVNEMSPRSMPFVVIDSTEEVTDGR